MKTIIRRNVFETNSSSTHSLTYSAEPPKSYTFECNSPWARLYMLKALLNCSYPIESFSDENGSDELDPSAKNRPVDTLAKFVRVCEDVICEKENVQKGELLKNMVDRFYCRNGNEETKAIALQRLQRVYDRRGESMCEGLFEEGVLDFCTCGFDAAHAIFSCIFEEKDPQDESIYPDMANEYLYGEKRFFADEYYCGCDLINAKNVY